MRYTHEMPFGAEVRGDEVRFGLWAPAAERVDLELGSGADSPRFLSMQAGVDGWFERTAPASAGDPYRFRIDAGITVPDPASRFQPEGVHGPSRVVDPAGYRWEDSGWNGLPWEEAVLYELHVGTFTEQGTYGSILEKLDHLSELGVTALELMPVAAFSGKRGWGYDGVLPFAPTEAYGDPNELKRLVDAAHARGLMVLLDVVYNHFGPDGNFLPQYAPAFFTDRFQTPWGEAIDFSQRPVRDFFIHNALYWIQEYRFDGLRLDAVHAIRDDSRPDFLEELAATVRREVAPERQVHLVLENGRNEARYLERESNGRPRHYTAQWNDDIHHSMHVVATGERSGYYEAFAEDPIRHLTRCLTEGFAYQGESFSYTGGKPRGEPSGHLPPQAFVSFIQNHDQVGNRAFGERVGRLVEPPVVECILTVLLLSPAPPLLFMGEEWDAPEPFLYFCDFHDELARLVRDGRRREFARFEAFRDEEARRRIPDPNAEETFRRSVLDWSRLTAAPHADRLRMYRKLLALRQEKIVPLLKSGGGDSSRAKRFGERALEVRWRLRRSAELILVANLSDTPAAPPPEPPRTRLLHATPEDGASGSGAELPPWSATWYLG